MKPIRELFYYFVNDGIYIIILLGVLFIFE